MNAALHHVGTHYHNSENVTISCIQDLKLTRRKKGTQLRELIRTMTDVVMV